jgi:hypothetical protein
VTTRHYARVVEGRDQEIAASFDALREAAKDERKKADRARSGHNPIDDEDPSAPADV